MVRPTGGDGPAPGAGPGASPGGMWAALYFVAIIAIALGLGKLAGGPMDDLRRQEEIGAIREEGRIHARIGGSDAANPYVRYPLEAKEWLAGWQEERAKARDGR